MIKGISKFNREIKFLFELLTIFILEKWIGRKNKDAPDVLIVVPAIVVALVFGAINSCFTTNDDALSEAFDTIGRIGFDGKLIDTITAVTMVNSEWWHGHRTGCVAEIISQGVIYNYS